MEESGVRFSPGPHFNYFIVLMNKNDILKREKEILEKVFNEKINIPDLPSWVAKKDIYFWNKNIFHLHYLPKISIDEDLNFPSWQDKPNKVFYRKIKEGKLNKKAKFLPGKWILIDGRDKPKKKALWIRSKETSFLKKIGLNPKNYFKKWDKQLHQNEYLSEPLKENGFGSRFCLSIHEIDNLKPFILDFLNISSKKNIRLPFFIEYNYLGNIIYKQWRTTKTWEWFEDKLDDNQYLAGGSKNLTCIGWEPPDFWSTILTFRPVIEL